MSIGIQSELGRGENTLDMSATMAGITDPDERVAWNKQRRESPKHSGTLGAIAPNEGGDNGILARTGKYGKRGGVRMALHNDPMQRKHKYDDEAQA